MATSNRMFSPNRYKLEVNNELRKDAKNGTKWESTYNNWNPKVYFKVGNSLQFNSKPSESNPRIYNVRTGLPIFSKLLGKMKGIPNGENWETTGKTKETIYILYFKFNVDAGCVKKGEYFYVGMCDKVGYFHGYNKDGDLKKGEGRCFKGASGHFKKARLIWTSSKLKDSQKTSLVDHYLGKIFTERCKLNKNKPEVRIILFDRFSPSNQDQ